jgi:multidrug efflux pump subunit AcrA (membrane-fusion protein)
MSTIDEKSLPEAHSEPERPNADLGFDLPPPAVLTKTRAAAISAIVIVALGGAFAAAYLPRRSARAALEEGVRGREGSLPRVEVVKPKEVSSNQALTLPGSIQPLEQTVIYPRVSGYVRKWTADIGDKVEEGQVLAEIDTPDLDTDLAQARAELAKAQAGLVQAQASRDLSAGNQPQGVAPSVRTNVPATVSVREFAGQVFQGTIARTAGALDPASRTLNTEVRVPNPDGKLLVGMFAQVALTLPTPHAVLEVPATSLPRGEASERGAQ